MPSSPPNSTLDFSPRRPNVTPPDWFNRPLRWVNPTLVQTDPGRWDLGEWLDFIARAKCDAASWNSGGIIAFYPTNLPHHKRNERMGDTDPFGDAVEGCRKLGLIVTARVDHHATYEVTAQAHPEWIFREPNGEMLRHWAAPELWVTCPYGPYNSQFMTGVLREVTSLYMVDGFNHNRWSAPGIPNHSNICHCDFCQRDFFDFCGHKLPLAHDESSAAREYRRWREAHIFRLWDLWDGAVKAINPQAGILPGIANNLLTQVDLAGLTRRAHTMYHDHQGRTGRMIPPWDAGKGGKELRAVMGQKLVGNTFSVGLAGGGQRWKDSTQSEAELRLWAAECAANGMSLKFCKFSGELHDRRWLPMIEKIYNRLAKIEPYLHNTRPLANVAVVYSQHTNSQYEGASGHLNGMYHALIEARIGFEMAHESLLQPEHIDQFKLLILPSLAHLSDAACEALRQYVARGGSILATHETSLFDENGTPRPDFALGDLFGVRQTGPVQTMKNSYLRLEHETQHPILRGFENASRTINGARRVPVEATVDFGPPPITFIPPYPDLPMEEVYPRHDHTGIAEAYLREIGPSRVAYVPFDLDRTFWEVLDIDHARLLKNLVLWALGEDPPAVVEGPGILDVTLWEQQSSMALHLVNFTNPMMMKGPCRELLAVGAQKVRVRLPPNREIKRVRLLTADATPVHRVEGGWLHAVVPGVLEHEILAVDFEMTSNEITR